MSQADHARLLRDRAPCRATTTAAAVGRGGCARLRGHGDLVVAAHFVDQHQHRRPVSRPSCPTAGRRPPSPPCSRGPTPRSWWWSTALRRSWPSRARRRSAISCLPTPLTSPRCCVRTAASSGPGRACCSRPAADVKTRMDRLIAAEPFLGPMAADPVLRGLKELARHRAAGRQRRPDPASSLSPPMNRLADALEKLEAGKPAFFSWRALIGGGEVDKRELRKILLVNPKMDYSQLEPGAAAGDALRADAKALALDPAHGVTVRLTGPVPLEDEEFGSLAERALPITIVAVLAIVLMLSATGGCARHADHRRDPDHHLRRPRHRRGAGPADFPDLQRDLDRLHPAVRRARDRLRHPAQRALPRRARAWHCDRRGADAGRPDDGPDRWQLATSPAPSPAGFLFPSRRPTTSASPSWA